MRTPSRTATIFVVVSLLWVGSAAGSVYVGTQIDAEVGEPLQRAQAASDADALYEHLVDAREGMEKWGYTSGHYALVLRSPATDAGEDYRTVLRLISRTERLQRLDPSSDAYRTGVREVRRTLRGFRTVPFVHWQLHTPLMWGYGMVLTAAFGWIPVLVLGLRLRR